MKHLVAILAHKNGAHLAILVQECIARGYEVRIHIDRKSRVEIVENFSSLAPYVISQSISVSRAHFSIVQATVALLQASKTIAYDYFHLISGEDFIIKSPEEFDQFFSQNAGLNFMNRISLPVEQDYPSERESLFARYTVFRDRVPISNYMHAFFKNGIGLIDTLHFRPGSTAHYIASWLTPVYRLRRFYQIIFSRKLPNADYFGGSAWFSITAEMAQFFIHQTESNPSFYNFFGKSLFPDEIYFQTLAMSSPWQSTIVNSDLRYINWDKPVNDGPSVLTTEHLDEIQKSNGFFARKMNLAADHELYKALQTIGIC